MRAFTWSALAVIVLQRTRDVTRVASGRSTQEDGPARVAQTGESEADVTDASTAVGHSWSESGAQVVGRGAGATRFVVTSITLRCNALALM